MLRQFFITISNENPRPYVNNLINGYLRNSITDYVKSSTRKDLRFEVAYY